jgi:hypothetical protein
MENMEGLGAFFLVIIPVSILFILITTRSAAQDSTISGDADDPEINKA